MNTDQYGLPVQLDRDPADQLQRVGMLAIAQPDNLTWVNALKSNLQPMPGWYCRFTNATMLDVTGDQLIPTLAYWALTSNVRQCNAMHHIFAQNIRKQGEPDVKTVPDFILLRTLPLLMRKHASDSTRARLLAPLRLLSDLLLILAALSYVLLQRKLDNVDDNNLIVTLYACKAKNGTALSKLAAKLYTKYRAQNYGSISYNCHPVIGAMRWYHRPEYPSYGNPEISDAWEPLINQILLENA